MRLVRVAVTGVALALVCAGWSFAASEVSLVDAPSLQTPVTAIDDPPAREAGSPPAAFPPTETIRTVPRFATAPAEVPAESAAAAGAVPDAVRTNESPRERHTSTRYSVIPRSLIAIIFGILGYVIIARRSESPRRQSYLSDVTAEPLTRRSERQ